MDTMQALRELYQHITPEQLRAWAGENREFAAQLPLWQWEEREMLRRWADDLERLAREKEEGT